MSTIDKICEKLAECGKTQKDLTDYLGLKKSAFSSWKSGKTKSYLRYIKQIADFLGTSVDNLLSEEDNDNRPIDIEKSIRRISESISNFDAEKFVDSVLDTLADSMAIPLIGTIACGTPLLAEQNIESRIFLPDMVKADFALRCKGDSMINAGISDGDIAFIRRQSVIENGEIAAVLITNFEAEATLKKIYIKDTSITLVAQNPNFEPLTFTGEDMNNVEIIGKCVAVLKDFDS